MQASWMYKLSWMRYLSGAALPCLLVLSLGCARTSPAPLPELQKPPCKHPLVDPTSNAGLVQGILRYAEALDECSLNGAGQAGELAKSPLRLPEPDGIL